MRYVTQGEAMILGRCLMYLLLGRNLTIDWCDAFLKTKKHGKVEENIRASRVSQTFGP